MYKIPSYIDNLLFDYLSGELSKENERKLQSLLDNSGELREYKDKLEQIWNGEKRSENDFGSAQAFLLFKKRVYAKKHSTHKIGKTFVLKSILRVAAAIIVVLSIGYTAYQHGLNTSNQTSPVVVTCSPGENAQVTLPDGSKVWINSESTLTYYKDFNKNSRHIYLSGEAFFEVESDKKRPFFVNAGDITVKATGTKFNVKAYSDEPFVETCLVEGVVGMNYHNEEYKLLSGDVVSVNRHTNLWSRDKMLNNDLFIGWKEGKLIFKNEKLSSLTRKFERFYDVTIETEPAVDSIRFSGVLQYESIDELLNILNETQGIVAKKRGKKIYLSLTK
ncbi:FecR family protein [Plebeiibacterium marinum]|uniref:FecR family protein n=1 Tax=Plebeiibacterium marinum TaxID=2992111 RepID=A0AAE3MGL9_9BACT|nr:FecR family protein [Plebeiobacterium marinum]MCW3806657.1 FecR family protein [Plebeiobacterium marinum]